MTIRWIPFLLTVCGALCPRASAQFENPAEKIKEIAEEVAKELQEIDRLLLQTGTGSNAAEGMKSAAKRMGELLDQSKASQGKVVNKIDELIKTLEQMKGQQSQSGGQSQGQQRDGQKQRQQGQQQRQATEVPDGEQPMPNPQGQQPKSSKGDPEQQGQNRPADRAPQDGTERVKPADDTERWGVLPAYEEMLKNRGGRPKVPEKYRRFHEAFLKQQAEKARRRRR